MTKARIGHFVLAASFTSACMTTSRAEDVVKTKALRDTDCATIEITRGPEGVYIAQGCGKTVTYACDHPAKVGTSYAAADNCTKVDPPK